MIARANATVSNFCTVGDKECQALITIFDPPELHFLLTEKVANCEAL